MSLYNNLTNNLIIILKILYKAIFVSIVWLIKKRLNLRQKKIVVNLCSETENYFFGVVSIPVTREEFEGILASYTGFSEIWTFFLSIFHFPISNLKFTFSLLFTETCKFSLSRKIHYILFHFIDNNLLCNIVNDFLVVFLVLGFIPPSHGMTDHSHILIMQLGLRVF